MKQFTKVPNKIISYSCEHNHYVLPLYLYSAINKRSYNDTIDTNLYHIARTFSNTSDKRYSKEKKFLETLLELTEDVKCEKFSFSRCFEMITDNYSPEYSERIIYKMEDNKKNINDNFTIVYYDEYDYLINFLNQKNNELGRRKNVIDILNFYIYIKKIISINSVLDIPIHLTIKTLSEKNNIGKNTVTEYTNLLRECKMIEIKKGDFETKKSNEYLLSDKWKN